MKKIVLIVLLTLLGGGLSAQTNSRKAARQVEKARRAAMDSVLHLGAVQALESGAFVVEVDRLIFKRGRTASVSSNTNFVSRDGDEAFVQIAFNTVLAGPNGVGGIAVRGNVSDVTVRTDKKGYLYYGMNVQGIGISARVDIMLIPGADRASVTVDPNYSSNRITMEGRVLPSVDSRVFKGRFH